MDEHDSQHSFSQDPRRLMSRWYEGELGQHLLEVERRLLERVLARRFGYHLVELGCADLTMYGGSPIGHKFSFAPRPCSGSHQAVARGEAIPLASETVDLVLLHHALDYAQDQHQLLREASRILIAGGCMVIVGFNPYSTWGLRRKLQWRATRPWNSRPLSPIRLVDWLKLLDFQVEQVQYGAYALPIDSPRVIRYSAVMDRLASRLNWPTGGVYVIAARKQVLPLTPVNPPWRRFPVPAGLPAVKNIRGASRPIPQSSNNLVSQDAGREHPLCKKQ